MENWKETKREKKEIEGNVIIVTTEERISKSFISQKNKDLIDITVKIIGAFAIALPLILVYLQFKYQMELKKNESMSQLLTEIVFDTEIVRKDSTVSQRFQLACDNLLYKYPAKIAVFKIESLNFYYRSIVESFKILKETKHITEVFEELNGQFGVTFNDFGYGGETKRGVDFDHRNILNYDSVYIILYNGTADQKINQLQNYLTYHNNLLKATFQYSKPLQYIPIAGVHDSLINKLNENINQAIQWSISMKDRSWNLLAALRNNNPKMFLGNAIKSPPGQSYKLEKILDTIKEHNLKIDSALEININSFQEIVLLNIKG